MTALKKIFRKIRTNGCAGVQEARSIRQIVYANLIWLSTFSAFTLYAAIMLLFIPVPLLPFLAVTLAVQLLFAICFLLIKYRYTETGKHLLIISTYLMLTVIDHAQQKETYIFLYFFAFLPSAMNVFTFSKKKMTVVIYTVLPLIYALVTKLAAYAYPSFPPLSYLAIKAVTALNLVLVFILFVLFGTYMVLNNMAKQQKLLLRSIGLQATLDNSGAAVWTIDREYNLMVANLTYTGSIEKEFGVTGIKPGINLRMHELWTKLPDAFKEEYEMVLSGQDILHEIALNGRNFEIKAVPIYNPNGEISGATFSSRDITDWKKAEATLLEAKRTAEEAGMARTRFLSNMSHEIRTPLNGIIGISRIMQDEAYLPEQLSNLQTLQDLSEHTLQLINNILDFAKIEAGKADLEHKRFNLKRLLNKIHSIFAGTAASKGLQFGIETNGPADIYVMGDEVRLSQVLINLLGNAFKFTHKGMVRLTADTEYGPGGYRTDFAVSDTGIGIKTENIHAIFESFSQADSQTTRQFGGTGLGLSIADKIISLMNSWLTVESEYGKGSTFRFSITLPASSFTPSRIDTPVSSEALSLAGITILLAEDNKINQMVANGILKKWKGRVTIASNGREALERMQEQEFAVVLMDLDMPVMDGYEATAIIKKKYPQIPVIALTAAAFDDMDSFLINKGFDEVVQKPFIPADLYHKIAGAIQASAESVR